MRHNGVSRFVFSLEQVSKSRNHQLRNRIWLIAAIGLTLGCCVYQCYYISEQYFGYGVVSDVKIRFASFVRPPTVVACFDMATELEYVGIKVRTSFVRIDIR